MMIREDVDICDSCSTEYEGEFCLICESEEFCPGCGGENYPSGSLGSKRHYNCRYCGMWYT